MWGPRLPAVQQGQPAARCVAAGLVEWGVGGSAGTGRSALPLSVALCLDPTHTPPLSPSPSLAHLDRCVHIKVQRVWRHGAVPLYERIQLGHILELGEAVEQQGGVVGGGGALRGGRHVWVRVRVCWGEVLVVFRGDGQAVWVWSHSTAPTAHHRPPTRSQTPRLAPPTVPPCPAADHTHAAPPLHQHTPPHTPATPHHPTAPHLRVQPLQVVCQAVDALHVQEALDDVGGLQVADGERVPAQAGGWGGEEEAGVGGWARLVQAARCEAARGMAERHGCRTAVPAGRRRAEGRRG